MSDEDNVTRRVWKFYFDMFGVALVPGEVLTVAKDGDKAVCVWSLVEVKDEVATGPSTLVRLIPTGVEVPEGAVYHSTVRTRNLVFHAFIEDPMEKPNAV